MVRKTVRWLSYLFWNCYIILYKTNLIGVVGTDFTDNEWNLFKKHNINTESVEIVDGATFSWGGEYNHVIQKEIHYSQN